MPVVRAVGSRPGRWRNPGTVAGPAQPATTPGCFADIELRQMSHKGAS
ncbi:hypothetical protein [Streptomyces smyrnaeus]